MKSSPAVQELTLLHAALLGAILFHRSLGNLRPSSFECAGVTFVRLSSYAAGIYD